MTEQQDLHAGDFNSWLGRTLNSLDEESGVDVPCGECSACCRSSYFIHIKPEDTQTIARIPRGLLFPAPGLPKGNVLLGFDKKGQCPMLVDGTCSIYDNRPQTCRSYDCRIFPATGIEASEENKALIKQQAGRWKFSFPNDHDRNLHSAVRSAAMFLQEQAKRFPPGFVPGNTTQLAILAIKVYDVFIKDNNEFGKTGCVDSETKVAKAIMETFEQFEARRKSPKDISP